MAKYFGEDALVELWQSVVGEVAKAARIAAGSYVGNGKSGADHPVTITFPFAPKIVFLSSGGTNYRPYPYIVGNEFIEIDYDYDSNTDSYPLECPVTIGDRKLSWHLNDYGDSSGTAQLNGEGTTYRWVAIG